MKGNKEENVNENKIEVVNEEEVTEMKEKKKLKTWQKIVIGVGALGGALGIGYFGGKAREKKYSHKDLGPDEAFEDNDRYATPDVDEI